MRKDRSLRWGITHKAGAYCLKMGSCQYCSTRDSSAVSYPFHEKKIGINLASISNKIHSRQRTKVALRRVARAFRNV